MHFKPTPQLRAVVRVIAAAALVSLSCGSSWAGGDERQSPINIDTTQVVPTHQAAISSYYAKTTSLSVVNTYNPSGTVSKEFATLKANVPSGSYVMVDGVQYDLLQFHFHTPSEHQVDGAATPMEVHFVHLRHGFLPCDRNPDGLLVIGAQIAEGQTNRELDKIFGKAVALPAANTSATVNIADFSLSKVMNKFGASWRYSGSLTAPSSFAPTCTEPEGTVADQIANDLFPENVSWVVLRHKLYMSKKQIERFRALFEEGNARPTQALNGRTVTTDTKKAPPTARTN